MARQGQMFKKFIGETLVKDKGERAAIGRASLQVCHLEERKGKEGGVSKKVSGCS